MRDYSLCSSVPQDAIYKEVVVVGNGPSGIALSYLLAGNWPYYTGSQHPDELLTARLQAAPRGRSLVQQDLRFLSQGLEGRTTNPVSLLIDTLCHPCADLGLDLPSLLDWRRHPEQLVDHVVLGKGPPGGTWQTMDSHVLTISLGSWMELPGLDFRTWDTAEVPGLPSSSRDSRASVAAVARYYRDYVKTKGLARFFRTNTLVTSIRPIDISHCQGTETIDPETGVQCCQPQTLWRVEGFDMATNSQFCYVSRRVVVATGSTDLPNRLGVPGEVGNPSWVLHDVRTLEGFLDDLAAGKKVEGEVPQCDPVLIVGAGLSAADGIIAARFRAVPILHVFRSKAGRLEKQLPSTMYPEYHKVHQMMEDGGETYPNYTALSEHKVLEISPDHVVRLEGPNGKVSVQRVSAVAILIGSSPDLSFLPEGIRLGVNGARPIDCKTNPIHVEPFSYSVVRAPPGLYALGPLAGDNFVRFLKGGALAITSHIHKDTLHHTML